MLNDAPWLSSFRIRENDVVCCERPARHCRRAPDDTEGGTARPSRCSISEDRAPAKAPDLCECVLGTVHVVKRSAVQLVTAKAWSFSRSGMERGRLSPAACLHAATLVYT
jgi:hypothetical protein